MTHIDFTDDSSRRYCDDIEFRDDWVIAVDYAPGSDSRGGGHRTAYPAHRVEKVSGA